MKKETVVLLLLLAFAAMGRGQQPLPATMATATVSDSVVVTPSAHSPTKALLLSLIPGGGQIYNGQAWKLPIVYGVIGGMGYLTASNYSKMKMFKEDYLHRVNNNGVGLLEEYANDPNYSIYNLYQKYNKNFQLFVMLTAASYALNLIDAYVFGHLYDFQMDDNLSLRVQPAVVPTMSHGFSLLPAVGLSLRF